MSISELIFNNNHADITSVFSNENRNLRITEETKHTKNVTIISISPPKAERISEHINKNQYGISNESVDNTSKCEYFWTNHQSKSDEYIRTYI